jgi:hypothetical protein
MQPYELWTEQGISQGKNDFFFFLVAFIHWLKPHGHGFTKIWDP